MNDYDNNMKGVLFKNARKEKPSQPDVTGEITIDDVTYRLAGWNKTARSGNKFLSLAVSPKEQAQQSSGSDTGLLDDEIPY